MKRLFMIIMLSAAVLLPTLASGAPLNGTFLSADLGGQLLTGRACTWRPGINSGLPHVLHMQSWDNTTLGLQWEIECAVETDPFDIQDNRDASGTGSVVYTSTFYGGTFTFHAGGWPWGDGTGTLTTTTIISTVQFMNWTPVASVASGSLSGLFSNGAALSFSIANGVGVGETSSLFPDITKPADYPEFLDDTCGPAPAEQQFGTWGTVISITMQISGSVANDQANWGTIKTLYK